MAFEITNDLLENVILLINTKNDEAISSLFSEMHYADIAEILDEIPFDDAVYIIKLLDSETTSAVFNGNR